MEQQAWDTLLTLLSLDTAAKVYSDLSIPTEDHKSFLTCLRDSIIENRNAHPNNSIALSDLFLNKLRTTLGTKDTNQLYEWAQRLFRGDHADQPQWSAWEIIFSQWSNNTRFHLNLPAENDLYLLTQYRSIVDPTTIDRKIEKVRAEPLSDWDLEMYTRHGFSNTSEYSAPFATLKLMIRVQRMKQFWEAVWTHLSPEVKDILLQEGQKVIDTLGVWMPGPLQPLDSLREG